VELTRLREERARGEQGFTLIELLVVVVIIGILIAIAIPVYLNYKKGASDKSAQSDLRNAVNVLEQCINENGAYPSAPTDLTGTPTGCALQTFKRSAGTTFAYYPSVTSPSTSYILGAWNTNGTGSNSTSPVKIFSYSSVAGGSIVSRATALSAYAATC
jgi:type IV pilus assembly protein PilA